MIYITEVMSLSGDSSLSNVSNDGTLLTSKITLENDKDSTTSIKVQLYNSTNIKYIFKNIVYTNEAYDNEDITFTFNKQNENIEPGKTLEVTLTFKYDNYNTDSLKMLNSLLNFKFAIASQTVAEYPYTGNYETFIVPKDGIYKIKLGEWNHMVIKLSDFKADIQPGLDKTNLNYIRIYWNNTINNTPLYEIPNCKIKNFMFSSYVI